VAGRDARRFRRRMSVALGHPVIAPFLALQGQRSRSRTEGTRRAAPGGLPLRGRRGLVDDCLEVLQTIIRQRQRAKRARGRTRARYLSTQQTGWLVERLREEAAAGGKRKKRASGGLRVARFLGLGVLSWCSLFFLTGIGFGKLLAQLGVLTAADLIQLVILRCFTSG